MNSDFALRHWPVHAPFYNALSHRQSILSFRRKSPIYTEMKVIITTSIFNSGPIRNWEFIEGSSHHHFWAYKFKLSSPHLPPPLHKNPPKTATLKNPLWLVQMPDPKWILADPQSADCMAAARWAATSVNMTLIPLVQNLDNDHLFDYPYFSE